MPNIKKRANMKGSSARPNKRAKQVVDSLSNAPRTPAPTGPGNELFARLPFEVRVMIWALLLKSNKHEIEPHQVMPRSNKFSTTFDDYSDDYDSDPDQSLEQVTTTLTRILMTCRLFYQDQQDRLTFYELNKFLFDDPTTFIEYLASITPSRRRALGHITIGCVTLHHPATKDGFWRGLMGSSQLFLALQDCVGLRSLALEFDRPHDSRVLTHSLRKIVSCMPLLERIIIGESAFANREWRRRALVILKAEMTFPHGLDNTTDSSMYSNRILLAGTMENVSSRFSDVWRQMRGEHPSLPLGRLDDMKRRSIYHNIEVDVLGEDRAQREPKSFGPSSHTRSRTGRQVNEFGQFATKAVFPKADQVQTMWQPFREIRMSEQNNLQLLLVGPGLKTPLNPRSRLRKSFLAQGSQETWKDLNLILHHTAPEDVVVSFACDLVGFYWRRMPPLDQAGGTPHPHKVIDVIEYYLVIEGDESPSMRGVLANFRRIATVWDCRLKLGQESQRT